MANNHQQNFLIKTLRSSLKRNLEFQSLIEELSTKFDLEFSIESSDGNLLIGSSSNFPKSYQLSENGTIYGTLHSSGPQGQILANLVKFLISKEIEKKGIGIEVLGLYREINMIYNFSEKISEKIDHKSIAETALNEAQQIIDITHGSVFILEHETEQVLQTARLGHNPNPEKSIENQTPILKELILKGTSLIVPQSAIKTNSALNHLKAVMYAPLKVKNRTLGLIVLGNENEKEFTAAELKLLTTIALQSAAAIESALLYEKGLREAREREEAIRTVHAASQKFVPNQFIKSLGKENITEVNLGDQVERDVTVMFVDIRGFTTLSENMSPTENFLFINAFNKRMGPIVRKNEGFIMQYLGDGFMAIFPKGAQNALMASIHMQIDLKEYNRERESKKRKPVKIGIGMQNGKLIMGITGDVERMDAAIISDTVNTAARIEGLSKYYGVNILLTDLCMRNITDKENFHFRYLGPVRVQGKLKPIELYECIDGDDKKLFNHKLKTMNTFKQAMDLYFKREFAMAAVTFQKIVKKNSEDKVAKLFLNKAAQLITQEIAEDWQGIDYMDSK
ncbi:adenylate/guanylate cyclase domain-containing protein [Aegicerativicinus sediminis]|uniref:adenylate/guanylate cyclase domain-containing protein n=1 Tax=Aegicerativicinus sediminis TaxID=2893202 RepID=UPI001E6324BD|nr:adenylate/guanylate cyclase domain-containing protein [Aegicerativicinus sediminis]